MTPIVRNFATIAFGSIAAQAINLVGFAVAAFLLPPSDFGIFAAHLAVSTPLAVLATGRFEVSFIRAERDGVVANLLAACFLSFLVVTGVVLAVLGLSPLGTYLGGVTFLALLASGQAANAVLVQLSNCNRFYNAIGLARFAGALAGQAMVLSLAAAGAGAAALVLGIATGLVTSAAILGLRNGAWIRRNMGRVSPVRLRTAMRAFAGVSLFNIPQSLASALQESAAILIVTTSFGAAGAGLYAMASRLLGAPVAIVAESLGRVLERYFADHARSARQNAGDAATRRRALLLAIATTSALGLLLTVGTILVGAPLAGLVFSNEWLALPDTLRNVAPYFGAMLAASALVSLPIATGAPFRLLAVIGTAGSVFFVLLLWAGAVHGSTLAEAFAVVSGGMVVYFAGLIAYIYIVTARRMR